MFGRHSSLPSRARATRATALAALAVVACAAVSAPNAADAVTPVAPAAVIPATHDLWHMDEASGTTMKDATGNHPGSLHTVELAQIGVASTGYRFNGTSSYVRIPRLSGTSRSRRVPASSFEKSRMSLTRASRR